MKVVQETERLLLRPFEVSDAEALMQMEQEPDFLRYVGRKPFVDVEAYRIKIQSLVLPFDSNPVGYGSWAVIEKWTGDFVGACSLRPGQDAHFAAILGYQPDDVEIGYGFCRAAWGQGYATEIVRGLIGTAFQLLHASSVVACVMVENLASIRVLVKNGFKSIGKPIRLPGEREWSIKYGIARKRFEQNRQ